MAPPPKPPGARVRRNKDQPTWKELEPSPAAVAPDPPEHWLPATKEWWALVWASPMAKLWVQSDVPNLLELGNLIELPRKSAMHYAEIRQMKACYGLTPAARKSLMWHIPAADEAVEERPEPKKRHLRAV